jgi:adenylate cyclase class 2
MHEIEVKILEVDVDVVVKKLEALGAKKVSDENISAIIYSGPGLGEGKTLRLRRKGDAVEFCFKRTLASGEAKSVEETEVTVSDFETTHQILLSLGYTEKRRVDKHRVSFALGDAHYEFDTISSPVKCPTYLEIEAHSIEDLRECVAKIGFSMVDTVDWSQSKVVERYS